MGLLICAGAITFRETEHAKPSAARLSQSSAKPTVGTAVAKRTRNSPMNAAHAAPSRRDKYLMVDNPEAQPIWAVRFGGEFWRHRVPGTGEETVAGKASTLLNPPFSLGDVIERVTHAASTDPTTGQPQVSARNYVATFDGQGVELSPSKPGIVQTAAADSANTEDTTAGRSSRAQPASASGQPIPDPATQVLFRTASIERDGQEYFSADQKPIQWTVTGNTVQGMLSSSSGIVEHYEAVNDGLEAAWVFQEPLPGTGPIEISATVDGLNYAGETDLGQHFADNTGVARVYVGQAEAVDSLGNRWALTTHPAAGNSGKLIVELPAAIQDEAVYPLAVDPIIGPEFGVDQPVSSAASGDQRNAAVTFGDNMFFVAWEDDRNTTNTATDIYGTRVSPAGAVLDPFGIAICATGSAQNKPSVAASGMTFFVTWQDGRLGGSDIFGARVLATTGAVLDPLGLAISFDPAQNLKANPSVAGGSSGFFAAWEDKRSVTFGQIFGARISTAGIVLDPAGVGISTNNANHFTPTVVCNSSNYFVAWEDNRNASTTGEDIYGGRVGTNGIVLDPAGVPLCTVSNVQTTPVAAMNHGTVLVAWHDRRNGNKINDIYGTRVNFTNDTVNVLDTNGIAISSNGVSLAPAVCALTNEFLVVWADQRNSATTGTNVYGARVSTNGSVLDTNGFAISTNAGNQLVPAIVGSPSGALCVWTDPRNAADTGNDIFGARISNLGVLEDTNGIVISRSGSEESSPSVAFNGTNYLVVWQDERNFLTNSTDIIGTRVSAAGSVLDLHGINICTMPAAQQHPSVGASSGEFLVAWEDSRNLATDGVDIYATRVSAGGAVSDPAGLALSQSPNNKLAPSVAGNQATFLIAWNDNQNATPGIYGTLVSQSGVISLPGGFPIAANTGNEMFPSIAANSNQFLVAFEDTAAVDVFASRVANNGTVLDNPFGGAHQLAFNGSETTPSAASLGTNYLVAWADTRNSATNSDIYAARVFGDGTTPDSNGGIPTSGFAVCTLPNNQINPAVSADANVNSYVVAWQNQGAVDGNDLYSARIGTNGSVLDFWTVPLSGTGDCVAPRLAYGGAGKFLLVSEAFRNNSTIVAGNLMTAAPPTGNLTVQFSAATYSVSESGKFAQITVTVTGKYSGEVTVDFATADGTATAGVDYMPAAGRLVFSSKKTSATVLVPIIATGAGGPNKTVNLTLQNPMGGVLIGAQPTATLTILE